MHYFVWLVWVTILGFVLLLLFSDIIVFFHQLSYIILYGVHTNYTKYDI